MLFCKIYLSSSVFFLYILRRKKLTFVTSSLLLKSTDTFCKGTLLLVVTGHTGVNYGIVTSGNVGRVDVAVSCLHLWTSSEHSMTLSHMLSVALGLAPPPPPRSPAI